MCARQNPTTLSFPCLITYLYRWGGVPFVDGKDVEITPSSACDIRRIEAEYLQDKAEQKKKKALVDSSSVADVESLEDNPTPPVPTVMASGIPATTSSHVPPTTSHPS